MESVKQVLKKTVEELYPGVLEKMVTVERDQYTQYEIDEYVNVAALQALLDR